jgi:hypothetical protein
MTGRTPAGALLRDADMEAFRTLLLAEHQRRLDAFTVRQEELQRRGHGPAR